MESNANNQEDRHISPKAASFAELSDQSQNIFGSKEDITEVKSDRSPVISPKNKKFYGNATRMSLNYTNQKRETGGSIDRPMQRPTIKHMNHVSWKERLFGCCSSRKKAQHTQDESCNTETSIKR